MASDKNGEAVGPYELRLPAIEVQQGGRRLYSFGVDGKVLRSFATVSRIRRDDNQAIHGYQRPEVVSHIAGIRRYIESDDPLMPNALVIAFDDRVRFEPAVSTGDAISCHGELVIPINPDAHEVDRPGWVVDGQQRSAAIHEARVEQFPVFVTAFIASSEEEQRSQFILVNNTKPLPRGLIYELLPETQGPLPTVLQRRQFPSQLLARLNHDEDSPLLGRINTPTNGDGAIKDNSILRMIENSLKDGALYPYWDPRSGSGDVDVMLGVLKNYWTAVSNVFPVAWDLPPRKSRLIHGVGIRSMGLLMDAITDRFRDKQVPSVEDFETDLRELEVYCRWCAGYWDFGPGVQKKWNDLQNMDRDVTLLANYLLTLYKQRVWDRVGT